MGTSFTGEREIFRAVEGREHGAKKPLDTYIVRESNTESGEETYPYRFTAKSMNEAIRQYNTLKGTSFDIVKWETERPMLTNRFVEIFKEYDARRNGPGKPRFAVDRSISLEEYYAKRRQRFFSWCTQANISAQA